MACRNPSLAGPANAGPKSMRAMLSIKRPNPGILSPAGYLCEDRISLDYLFLGLFNSTAEYTSKLHRVPDKTVVALMSRSGCNVVAASVVCSPGQKDHQIPQSLVL